MTGADFSPYVSACLTSQLLPIIPPGALLSPSAGFEPKRAGKIPGKKTRDGWVGFEEWTKFTATAEDVALWAEWGAGVGLKTRELPSFDIDTDDNEIADAVEACVTSILGPAPCRDHGSVRRLLVYGSKPGPKKKLVKFTRGGVSGAIELLGDGQQFVAEGIHKSGARYAWRGERRPSGATLTAVTAEQLEQAWGAICEILAELGCEITNGSAARARHVGSGSTLGVVAPSLDAVSAALAAVPNESTYDEWLRVCAYVKGATGGSEEGFEIFDEWSATWEGGADPGDARAKWDSVRPPWKTGWPQLARWAGEASNGRFSGAAFEFEAVGEVLPAEATSPVEQMLKDYVYVRNPGCAVELATRDFLTREPFNITLKAVGPPDDHRKCAWAVFNRHPEQRWARSVTYAPFKESLIEGEGGALVNLWRAPVLKRFESVTEGDIQPWLDLIRHVVRDARERAILLDWMAWVVQHQDRKPGWAVLMCSRIHGVGKGLLVRPLKYAFGRENTYEVREDDLSSPYTHWANRKKFVIIEEIAGLERKAMMQKLKSYLSSPPETITINEKHVKQFTLPNLFAAIFFTNKPDALGIEQSDRRFFVIDADVPKREAAFYGQLKDWLDADGEALVAQWLSERDVAAFEETALFEAPMTAAKEDMRKTTRSMLDEWVEDGIADREPPFDTDIVIVKDVASRAPARLGHISASKLGHALKRCGAVLLDDSLVLGAPPKGLTRLPNCSLRRSTAYAVRSHAQMKERLGSLAQTFWWQWSKALKARQDLDANGGSATEADCEEGPAPAATAIPVDRPEVA